MINNFKLLNNYVNLNFKNYRKTYITLMLLHQMEINFVNNLIEGYLVIYKKITSLFSIHFIFLCVFNFKITTASWRSGSKLQKE